MWKICARALAPPWQWEQSFLSNFSTHPTVGWGQPLDKSHAETGSGAGEELPANEPVSAAALPAVPVSLEEERGKRWKKQLLRTRGGAIKKLLANAITALENAPEVKGALSYNASSHRIMTDRAMPWERKPLPSFPRVWTDYDMGRLAEWLQRNEIEVAPAVSDLAAKVVARQREFHPIREWMEKLRWDGKKRLDHWLSVYLRTADRPYEQVVGSRWVISMVARTMKPGCKADCLLLLIGDQGQGKSTALEILASKEWFTDEIGIVQGGRDTPIAMAGKLLVEFSDLEGFDRKEANDLKAFISRTTDRFRGIFGQYAEDHPRQTIFAGTTNQQAPLKDFTGNRRYWPVLTGLVDLVALQRDREQIWAEAVVRYREGEPWWLDTGELRSLADAAAEERRAIDELELQVGDFLQGKEQVTLRELIAGVLEKTPAETSRGEQTRLGQALQAIGWEKAEKLRSGGGREWLYRPKRKAK